MKNRITQLALLAALSVGAAGAYAESLANWPQFSPTTGGQYASSQRAPSVYTPVAGGAARGDVKQVIELKDGSTVYIFHNGKMSMEDKNGRAVRMDQDTVMETKDGQKIIMHGDEVSRLDSLLKKDTLR